MELIYDFGFDWPQGCPKCGQVEQGFSTEFVGSLLLSRKVQDDYLKRVCCVCGFEYQTRTKDAL